MVLHLHTTVVEGCFRCALGEDEAAYAAEMCQDDDCETFGCEGDDCTYDETDTEEQTP